MKKQFELRAADGGFLTVKKIFFEVLVLTIKPQLCKVQGEKNQRNHPVMLLVKERSMFSSLEKNLTHSKHNLWFNTYSYPDS